MERMLASRGNFRRVYEATPALKPRQGSAGRPSAATAAASQAPGASGTAAAMAAALTRSRRFMLSPHVPVNAPRYRRFRGPQSAYPRQVGSVPGVAPERSEGHGPDRGGEGGPIEGFQ